MFANLLQLITRRESRGYEHGFVQEVHRDGRAPKNPRVGKLLFAAWLVIAAKCWLMMWLVERYHMPFNALWVNLPTIAFGLLITVIYFRRE
ncbi:MAG: hypothetical protein JSS11_01605 [Verrucomicrobia bacterium]|nr:hypothetical protein [Verrucomicrobiota bacterium]